MNEKRYAIIDSRMNVLFKNYLSSIGLNLIELDKNSNVYTEISSHVDIFSAKINNNIILEPTAYKKIKQYNLNMPNIFCGNQNVSQKYPNDIKYNVCQIGKNVIHNLKYTDSKILEIIENESLNKIDINQGYSNCSIAVIDDNSCIVSDKKIADILKQKNIDVLIINDNKNIKLLEKNGYSNMNGFIGGCIGKIDNNIICFGDIKKIDDNNMIRQFIKSKKMNLIDFKNQDVIDYGGILII